MAAGVLYALKMVHTLRTAAVCSVFAWRFFQLPQLCMLMGLMQMVEGLMPALATTSSRHFPGMLPLQWQLSCKLQRQCHW